MSIKSAYNHEITIYLMNEWLCGLTETVYSILIMLECKDTLEMLIQYKNDQINIELVWFLLNSKKYVWSFLSSLCV